MLKSHFNLVYDDDEPKPEEEQEQEEQDTEEEQIPERLLNTSEISVRLSLLGKTAEGDGYTYLKCKITGLKVTNIQEIKRFIHLMFVDVSHNYLDLNALQVVTQLPYLILIQADYNRLHSAALKEVKYLQVIIFNNNQITSVNDVFQPQLTTLELGYNKITKIAFDYHTDKMKVLDLRYNMITEITNLNLPMLDSLYLAGNNIKSLEGLDRLVNLRILHVRHNPIKLLNGFDECLTKLVYINIRNCKVATLRQIKKLKVLPAIETLVVRGCPYYGGSGEEGSKAKTDDGEEDPQLRVEVAAALPRLKRINKDLITPEEREESKELMMQWLDEDYKDEEEIEDEQNEEEQAAAEEQ